MRDKRFVANHMDGPLSLKDHKFLIHWAVDCVRHGIQTLNEKDIDERALNALIIALKLENGDATVGEAREAAFRAHDAARECEDKVKQAIFRACGHAVATAHMADHSLQARVYIIKALKIRGIETEKEKMPNNSWKRTNSASSPSSSTKRWWNPICQLFPRR